MERDDTHHVMLPQDYRRRNASRHPDLARPEGRVNDSLAKLMAHHCCLQMNVVGEGCNFRFVERPCQSGRGVCLARKHDAALDLLETLVEYGRQPIVEPGEIEKRLLEGNVEGSHSPFHLQHAARLAATLGAATVACASVPHA